MLALMVMVQLLGGPHPETKIMTPVLMTTEDCDRVVASMNSMEPPNIGQYRNGKPILANYFDCILVDGNNLEKELANLRAKGALK